MYELVPIVLGAVLGGLIWRGSAGKTRLALSFLAVLVSGATATVLSGEAAISAIYLLLDFGEAALGLAAGLVIVHQLPPARRVIPASLRKQN